jgi:hypothetical protein
MDWTYIGDSRWHRNFVCPADECLLFRGCSAPFLSFLGPTSRVLLYGGRFERRKRGAMCLIKVVRYKKSTW